MKVCRLSAFAAVAFSALGTVSAANECSSTGAANGTAKPDTAVCREAASICDIAEKCDGASLDCPSDAFAASTVVARASTVSSTDNCDPAEMCSGNSSVVPTDINSCVTVAIDVLGQSGKFNVFDQAKGKADPNMVTVEIDALKEVDEAGEAVGTTGKVKHSINTFAAQAFTILDPVDAKVKKGTGPDVDAQKISFFSTVSSIGKINFDTYVMKSGGTVGSDTESWVVRAGDVKWNIVLSEWQWCGTGAADAVCKSGQTDQVGAFIDIEIKIKGKAASPTAKTGNPKNYELGGGVDLELSDRVLVDGTWMAMPEGYPTMTTKGGAAIFKFRFPKFTTSATYDPVMGTSVLADPGPVTTAAGAVRGHGWLTALVAALVVAVSVVL